MTTAVQMRVFEGPEKMLDNMIVVNDKPKPFPEEGEILVHLTVRPLNPADIFSIMGVYPGFQPTKFPATPGLEGTGTVEAVGPGVTEFSVGQRVVPILLTKYTTVGEGSWQEYVVVKTEDAVAVPDSVTDEDASQLAVNPTTVIGILEELQVPAGKYLLQTAAGSTLGRMLILVAKNRGIKTINIVRRSEQKEELYALGADVVLSSVDDDVVSRVKEVTGGEGAYGAAECVGGELVGTVMSSLRDNGTLLIYGAMAAFTFTAPVPDVLFRGIVVKGIWITSILKNMEKERKKEFLQSAMELLEKRIIEPFIGEKIPLTDVKSAIEKHQAVGRGGKILLTT